MGSQRAVRERESQLLKREKALAAAGTEADERTAALAARQVAVQAAEAAASTKAEALAEAQQKLSAEREAHAQREQELSTAESEVWVSPVDCHMHHQPCARTTPLKLSEERLDMIQASLCAVNAIFMLLVELRVKRVYAK